MINKKHDPKIALTKKGPHISLQYKKRLLEITKFNPLADEVLFGFERASGEFVPQLKYIIKSKKWVCLIS